MSTTLIRSTLKTRLEAVSGIGTVDTVRFDGDGVPRKARGTTPYWALSVGGYRDEPASLGSSRKVFRSYRLRLEGWQGIRGTEEDTDTWEALVASVATRLLGSAATLAGAVAGFIDFRNVAAPALDVVQVAEGGGAYRAHHAVIECELQFYVSQ